MSDAELLRSLTAPVTVLALQHGADALDLVPRLQADNTRLQATVAGLEDSLAEAVANARPVVPDTHTVVAGDTLLSIGRKYLVQVLDLQAWNGMGTSTAIRVGQVLKLRAPVVVPPSDPEPTVRTQFGLNITGGDVAGHRAMFGGADLKNLRLFFQPGEAPHWNDVRDLRPSDRPWFSAKTLTEASLRAWVRAMPPAWKTWAEANPDEPFRFTYMHEGEANMFEAANPDQAIANYLAVNAMMKTVFATEPNGRHFEAWKILLHYTQVEDSRPGRKGSWPRFVGDQDIPVGVDCYWSGWKTTYAPAKDLLAIVLEIHAKTGLRVAVPEVGGVAVFRKADGTLGRNDADGTKRAAAIRELVAYVQTTPIEAINWWCGTGNAGDHHLDKYPSNVAAWNEGMKLNG